MKWRSRSSGREDGERANREIDDLLSSIMGCTPVSMWYGRRKGNNYINSLLLQMRLSGGVEVAKRQQRFEATWIESTVARRRRIRNLAFDGTDTIINNVVGLCSYMPLER
jgi:hypothetical protein